MFFPWPLRAGKRSKKTLSERYSRQRHSQRLQIDPLEERQLLAVFIEAEASFFDPARPQDVTVLEGNAGLTEAVFRVALDAAEASPVTVNVQTADGQGPAAAVQGTDYFAGFLQLTFNPGETEMFVTTGVFGDTIAELDESYFVNLSSFTGTGGIIKAPGARPIDVAGRGVVTITNDDTVFIQINDSQAVEGSATQPNAVFQVTLSGPSPNPVSVVIATGGGTATPGLDYTAIAPTTLVFNPGETTKIVTVVVVDDAQDELNETFFLNLSGPVNAQIQDPQGQGTIIDNEGIVVNIAAASIVEGNSGFQNMLFTVTLSEIRPSTINVQYRTDNVSAPPPQVIPPRVGSAPFQRPAMIAQPILAYQQNDYLPVSGQLTFAPGVTSQNITVQVRGENIHELNETFQMLLTSVTTNGAETINLLNTAATGTIVNDDQVPQLIVHDASTQGGFDPRTGQPIVDEGDNPLFATGFPEFTFPIFPLPDEPWTRPVRISVSLSNPSSGSIAVAYSTIGETATPGVDYRRSYPNPFAQNLLYFLGSATDAVTGDPPNFSTGPEIDPPYDITEYGPGLKPLTQPGGPSPTTGLPNEYAQVIFQPGEVADDIVLRIFKESTGAHNIGGIGNPPVPEGDETFLIRADMFSANSAPAIIADDTGRVVIIDDDPDPAVSIGPNATIVEGDNGQKFLIFTVNLGGGGRHELPVTIDFRTQQLPLGPGVAEAGVDYVTTQGTLTFNPRQPQLPPLPTIPGVTTQAFSVPIIGDFLDELDEVFQVILSNPQNATLGAATATGTIIDNEGPTASVGSDVTVLEGDTGTVDAVFSVGLSSATLQTVLIRYTTADGSATGGQDYTPTTGTVTFAAGTSAPQPVTVRVLGDTLSEGTEFFLLDLTNPNPGLVTIGDNQALGFIVDNDNPLRAVRIDDASVVEGNIGTSNLVFRLRLVNPDGSPITQPLTQTTGVGFFTENVSALSGQDYTAQSGNVVFNHTLNETEKLVTVPVIGDLMAEADETLLMRLTNPFNLTIFNAAAEGLIVDDDSVPGISIAASDPFELEGNNLVFNVTLSRSSNLQVTVGFNTANGSALAGSDYTAGSGTLTFAPGETTKTITVALLTDGIVESNETFTVGLTSPTNAVVTGLPATGTIVDIDSASIIVGNATVLEGGGMVFRLRLSQANPAATVDVATADNSATQPGDYTSTAGVISFASGPTVFVTVPTIGDSLDEIDETFFLNLSNPVNAALANAQGTGTIIDDDGPSVSIGNAVTFEGNAGLTFVDFTVSLSTGGQQPVTVVFATQDDTALDELPTMPLPNNDYRFTTGTLTFAPGEVTKKVRVTVQADAVDELDETFFVQLSNAQSNGFPLAITDGTGLGSIIDDDGPVISVLQSTLPITVREGSSGLVFVDFSIVLSSVSPQLVEVQYFTSDGTATGNVDYFPVNGTLSFPPGSTSAIVSVQISPDINPEADETFFLNLIAPTGGATIGAPNPIPATIVDDDTLLFINDGTVLEGDSGFQNVVLTVTMNQPRAIPVTATFMTVNGPAPDGVAPEGATAGQDYTATSGTITFSPGSQTEFITVRVLGDLIDEFDETFDVVLGANPVGAFIGDGTGTVTIIEDGDPQPIISVSSQSFVEGNSPSVINALFTVTLSGASGRQVTAAFNTVDITAAAGSDYTATSGTLTFAPNTTTQVVTIQILGDNVTENDETFQLSVSNIQFATPASIPLQATVTIIDDDPTLSITSVAVAEGNSPAVTDAVFAVTLSKPSSVPVTMNFATANGTAIAGLDYNSTAGSLSFAVGEVLKTITVQVLGDQIDEIDEQFSVNLTGVVGVLPAAIINSTGIGTVQDDDLEPVVSLANASVPEGDGGTVNAVFNVILSQASGKIITLNYSTSFTGQATPGVDFVNVPVTPLTFFPGETIKPIQVGIKGDLVLEQDENFAIDLTGVTNATPSSVTAIITILDDEPRLRILDSSSAEGDSGVTFHMVFTVELTKSVSTEYRVVYNTVDGSAIGGVDYQPVFDTLTFSPVDNVRTISVPILGDTLFEPDETFSVVLSGGDPPNLVEIQDGVAVGTILNNPLSDDPAPVISISDVSQIEGDSGPSNFVFFVSLDRVSALPATVQFTTANGPGPTGAAAGSDYQARTGVISFAPGEVSQAVTVPVIGDATSEPNEIFLLNLSNPMNAVFGDNSGQATIINDEPTVSIGDAIVVEPDSATTPIVFPVTLSRSSAANVTVVLATADGTAFAPSDYQSVSNSTLTFFAGEVSKSFTVQVQGDLVAEFDETFVVNLVSVNSAASILDGQAVGTIQDTDPNPDILISPVTTQEGNLPSNTPAVFTVQLSQMSGKPITVNFATADGTANAPADYFAAAGSLSFPPGLLSQNITVIVRGDDLGEGDETYFVTLSNPVNVNIPPGLGQGIGTIVDDEPRVTISESSVTEGDFGSQLMVFTVSMDAVAASDVTLRFDTFNGTATAGADYLGAAGSITFAPGQQAQTVSVTILGDVLDEIDEQFTVVLSGISGNASILDPVGVGTIGDNDQPPFISISNASVVEGNSSTTSAVFTVSLSAPSGRDLSATYTTVDVSANGNSDYVQIPQATISFAAGETIKTITVQVNGDTQAEPDETFEVRLANPMFVQLGVSTGIGLIQDDEPRISISDVSLAEGDFGPRSFVFDVSLSVSTTSTVTVSFATANGTAGSADFTAANGLVVFDPGDTLQQVTVQVQGDTAFENNELFLVNLSGPSNNAMILDGMGQGTIINDDAAPVVSVPNVTLVEGDFGAQDMVFPVTLSVASGLTTTVGFATANNVPASAVAGQDYTGTSGMLTFAPNETSKSIIVRITGDLGAEQDETFLLNLTTNGINATPATLQATGTIADNDATLTIAAPSGTTVEGNFGQTSFLFPVTLSRAINKPVTLNFTTSNGTGPNPATAPSDYTATSGTLSFAANETSKNITVMVIGDTTSEPNETFNVTISNVAGAIPNNAQATGNITNDDGLPNLSINSITVLEGDTGASNAVFTVSLSQASGQQVSVDFQTSNGSAVASQDYLAASGNLQFAAGEIAKQITVAILGDTVIEQQENFVVTLTNVVGANLVQGIGQGVINDNEKTDLIVTGPGNGGGPQLRAFEVPALTREHSFFVYDRRFGGGVRVASADVNGDGQVDMITGAGPGGGSHIRIFDGATGAHIRSFFAFPSFFGGVNVAAGDIDNDGRAEIFVGAEGPQSGGRVRVFSFTGALLQDLAFSGAFAGGVRVAAGDINGDGRSDLIIGAGPGNTPRVLAHDLATGATLADFFAYSAAFNGGVWVAAGDVTGDGRADIVTGADAGGGAQVRIFNGATRAHIRSTIAYPSFSGGVRVGVVDFNNDGIADIVTGPGRFHSPEVKILNGANLSQMASFFAYDPAFRGGVYVGGSLQGPGSPLRSPGNAASLSSEQLDQSQLAPLVQQAIANWSAQDAKAAQRLSQVEVRVADLPDGYVGMAYANAIYVDINADGHGWFVDTTPDRDEEFDAKGRARASSSAANRIDLLSVLAHEFGHILGLDDLSLDDHADDLMAEALSVGTRRSPSEAVDAVFGNW